MVVPTNKIILTTALGSFAAADMHTLPQNDPLNFGTRRLLSHSIVSFRRACFTLEALSIPS